jgi:hypothetical protein
VKPLTFGARHRKNSNNYEIHPQYECELSHSNGGAQDSVLLRWYVCISCLLVNSQLKCHKIALPSKRLQLVNHSADLNTAEDLNLESAFLIIAVYRSADKSLARPTTQCIFFDGENISFDASLVIYIYTNIPPIMIINRIYENQNLLLL